MRSAHLLSYALLAAATISAAQNAPPTTAAGNTPSGTGHLANQLVNDARDALRDPSLPPDAAAREATVLLQFAARLDRSDLHAQKLLGEAARISGKFDVQKEALRAIIAADPGDLVSQVRYIDLLAGASQALEARSKVYQGALQQISLDPQIRSEMALRLARIAQERGDNDQAKLLLAQSLKFNDVNIGALRDLVRIASADTRSPNARIERLKAIVALLTANPFQPDAWLDAARLCETAALHDRAVDLLKIGYEQLQIDGYPMDGDAYFELALEEAIAGQPEALESAGALAQLEDAPLEAMLIAQLIAADRPAGARGGPAATQSTPEKWIPEIRKRLAEMVKPDDATKKAAPAIAYADAAGVDLTILPGPGPETASWIETYAKEAGPDDSILAHLRGWLLYRQGKLADSQAILEKIAITDPLAQVGLARIYLDMGKKDLAARQLQDVWATLPTGLLALQVAQTARRAGIPLRDSSWSAQIRGAAAKLTPDLAAMHRSPRDIILMTVNYKKGAVGYGEAQYVMVRLSNTTEKSLPVGRDGVVKTTVGLTATGKGGQTSTGIYAVEDLQRVYRLPPHQNIESSIQVDQGMLADFFEQNPEKPLPVTVVAVTAPRILGGTQFGAGVGGQAVTAGDFDRIGLPISNGAEVSHLVQEINNLTGERRLVRIEAAIGFLSELMQAKIAEPQAQAASEAIKVELAKMLRQLAAPGSEPAVKATLLRSLSSGSVDSETAKAIDALSNDGDPLVRLMWAKRQERIARNGGEAAKTAVAVLEAREKSETDGWVKEWLSAAIPAAREASTRPAATQPATQPAK